MKLYLWAKLLLLALVAQSHGFGSNQSHSVIWGERLPNDYMVQLAVITEPAQFMRVVVRDYEVNQRLMWRRITQIEITDRTKNGDGGFASLISGGPPMGFARIRFTSQLSKGFSFIVEAYGI